MIILTMYGAQHHTHADVFWKFREAMRKISSPVALAYDKYNYTKFHTDEDLFVLIFIHMSF